MKRVCVLLALVCSLLVPSVARADGIDSFTRGLNDFAGNGVNEQVTPERDFIEQYEPQEVVLSSPPTRVYDEDSTTVDYVNGTLDSFNTVKLGSNNRSIIQTVQWFLGNGGFSSSPFGFGLVGTAMGLVFLWWGVRKSLRMIMEALRKGRQSV